MTAKLEPTAAFEARIAEGRTLAEAGDFEAAEQHFRTLLDEARGGHVGDHALALGSLVTIYGRAGRYLEAYLLARRYATLAAAVGREADKQFASALGKICGALATLHLDDALGRALRVLRSTLDRMPEPLPAHRLEYRAAAAMHAADTADLRLAREHLDAYRALLDQLAGMEDVYSWAIEVSESRLWLGEGHPDLAGSVLERFRARGQTASFHHLQVVVLGVSVAAARERPEEARAWAEEAIAILESAQNEAFLVSDRIHHGALLAPELEKLGELDMAQRVYDLVAAAVMIRMQQLDHCLRSLPELGLADPESKEILATFRKQFLQQQQKLLQRVATIFDSRGDEFVLSLLVAEEGSAMLPVCAWCECVRQADGNWLPVGHFIPREAELKVTHGICPSCAERLCA